ncbi:NUDIX hydrolase [Chitinophaga nivalis]|uniref:GDP-mannose pyrophosphatase n=1 Tax=Chitinophaga nivalis TaxID=2991709 RepID=A0ABT3IHN4_9BACT|nr:NUDIX hydrolase [Chitinophaga nivalis]MCW3466843.1 NUDIX hydrolase [Chitinophaga nivalis]MCW3483466.1 NUDIX hydrolase [Chitinophaga nivalis]
MMNMDWQLLSSEYLFKDQWLTARVDRCLTPSGKIVEPYYVLEYNNWVNAVALTADGQAIMVRQYRQGIGKTLLEIPGGTMDAGETSPLLAMQRELLEETGYRFEEMISLGTIAPNPASSNNITHMFLATGGVKVQEQELDPTEELEVVVMPLAELQQLVLDNKIVQSLHTTCIFYALLHLGKLGVK